MTDRPESVAVVEFRLRKIMDEKGLSVPDVSRMTGIPHTTLYMILNRLPRAVRFETLARLCLGLDIQPADLLVMRIVRVQR